MRYEILGPLRVLDGGRPVVVGGPRQQLVLAVLLAAAPDEVSVDRLVEQVWGSDAPSTAAHVIRTYVSNLRTVLGDGRITSDGQRYTLVLDGDHLDAEELGAALRSARSLIEIDAARALQTLEPVSSLRRGRPFGDHADVSAVVRARADELDEQWLEATELRMDAALRTGRHRAVLPELERLVAAHPLHEALAARLMLAFYRSGRQAEALGVYRQLRARLVEELGIDPSPALQGLEERILLQDPGLEPRPPHNVPAPLTTYVGRERELREVAKELENARVVTLVGVGGVGKTRLAREVAMTVLHRFPDGVWWVDLASVTGESAVLHRLAEVLGVSAQPGLPLEEVLRRTLARRRTLLVFDNCEHLEAGAPVARMLAAGDGVSVLATSRRSLDIGGEVRYPVPPLGLPGAEDAGRSAPSDSERLFRARAGDVGLTGVAVEDVARICRRLDGLPLAIEMAAAHARALTPGQIADRLETGSPDVLSSHDLDRAARHRSLDATIAWSRELLDPTERAVFERLSVFVGPFDLVAAEAVAGFPPVGRTQVLGAVEALVDASLLSATPEPHAVRFRMLQTLRDYAARQLAGSDAAETARRHAVHHLELLDEAGRLRLTPAFADVAVRLDDARDDVLVGLRWALEHDPERAIGAAAGVGDYWAKRGEAALAYRFGRRMLESASGVRDERRADALVCAAFGAALTGDVERAVAWVTEAVEISAQAPWQTRLTALHGLGNISLIVGDLDTVEAMGTAIVQLCDERRLHLPRAYGSSLLGFVAFFRDRDNERAGRHLDDAIEGMRGLHDFGGMKIYGLVTAATAAADRGEFEKAERYAAEAISIPGAMPWTAAAYITLAGYALFPQGELSRAGRVLERGTRLSYEAGGELWMRTGFLYLANLAARLGKWELSARFYGACRPNLPAWALDPRWWELEPVAREALGADTYDRLCASGEHEPAESVLRLVHGVVD